MKRLTPEERATVMKGISEMKKDDPVLFFRVSDANFTFKCNAAAPNQGGVTSLSDLADLIEEHGGSRIDESDYAFAFTNMGTLMACKRHMLQTAPWVRHHDSEDLTPAEVAALAPEKIRPVCDEVILVSQAPASGKVVASRFSEFFM